MKKIVLGFLSLILLAVVANFALWFFNTSAITGSLEQLKENLAKEDLIFDYKEVRFDSFKSWKIEGVIENPSLKAKFLGNQVGLSTPRIDFVSMPFKDSLIISVPGDHLAYQFVDKLMNNQSDIKLQFDPVSVPKIQIQFSKSLSELVPLARDNIKNIFLTLDNISLDVKNLSIVDTKLGLVEQTLDNFKFDIHFANPEKNHYKVNLDFKVINTKYNQEYIKHATEDKKLFAELNLKLGAVNLSQNVDLDFILDETEAFKEVKLDIKEYNYSNEKFKIETKGNLAFKKGDLMPNGNLNIALKDYLELISFYQEAASLYAKSAKLPASVLKLDEAKLKILKDILLKFTSAEGKDVIFDIKINNENTTISGRSIAEVMVMFQPLFASAPKDQPNEKPKAGQQPQKPVDKIENTKPAANTINPSIKN